MTLLLVEIDTPAGEVERLLDLVEGIDGATVIEAQVTDDTRRAFVVIEHPDRERLTGSLDASGVAVSSVEAVRLVGADLDDLKRQRPGGRYLVEWDLPAGITMDAYLARKREKAPLYATVPETTFLRTYVREDLEKCLCFYDADDEGAVLKARDAVGAPVDRLHHLAGSDDV